MFTFRVLDVEVAQTSMKDYDANKDGKLTWAEYVKKMKSDENDTESNSFKEVGDNICALASKLTSQLFL